MSQELELNVVITKSEVTQKPQGDNSEDVNITVRHQTPLKGDRAISPVQSSKSNKVFPMDSKSIEQTPDLPASPNQQLFTNTGDHGFPYSERQEEIKGENTVVTVVKV